MTIPTDLIERARLGDQGALDDLIAAAWPDAYRLAFAITTNRQCAQDAAQDACVIAYRKIGDLRQAGAFRAWFYRIVVREARRVAKNRATHEDVNDGHYDEDTAQHLDVWRAVESLPSMQRRIVILRYFEDLTSREIATILRIPDGTVRFQLMLARKQLRPLLHVSDESVASVSGKVQTYVV